MTAETKQPDNAFESDRLEDKRIRRMIRKGEMPRRAFVLGPDGKMERTEHSVRYPNGKLTWRTYDTFRALRRSGK